MPKLTLSADKDVIERAKKMAQERGTSVSAMFSEFVETLSSESSQRARAAPITRRLRGIAKAPATKSDRELFEEAIREKGRR